jgi:hypothetical protein
VTKPFDFQAMAAEQNHCPEMQRLLGGTSLTSAFHQAGAQRLVGDVSTGIFHPVVPEKFIKDFFSPAQHFPPRPQEARLPAPCFFHICLAKDEAAWVKTYLQSQQRKIHHQTQPLPTSVPQ